MTSNAYEQVQPVLKPALGQRRANDQTGLADDFATEALGLGGLLRSDADGLKLP